MSTLEAQVNLLASLIERLDTVRDISAGNLPVHLRNAINNVSALADELASTQAQDALAAAENEQGIRAIDLQNSRRAIRQRKNQVEVAPPAKRPESKKRPYPPKLGVPPPQDLTQKSLQEFVQNFNRANLGSSLSIWTATRAAVGQSGPLRMIVPNVLVAYVSLRSGSSNGFVRVESATVTGIREQRTTSEFTVFRSVSQHLFRTLAQNVDTDVVDLLSLIMSYNNLYTAKCAKCNSIHSSQDNTPAIIPQNQLDRQTGDSTGCHTPTLPLTRSNYCVSNSFIFLFYPTNCFSTATINSQANRFAKIQPLPTTQTRNPLLVFHYSLISILAYISVEPHTLASNPEAPFDTAAAPSGLASFSSSTTILAQYSHTGRMDPEFINISTEGYAEDDDRPAIALGRTITILGYEPREGTHRTRIVVRLLFRRGHIHPNTRVRLRVKMGNIPIYTEIEGIPPVNGVGGEWRLHLVAPDPRELDVVGLEVPLIVQVLDVQEATIIDDVCIGTFKFWNPTPAEESYTSGSDYFGPEPQGHDINEYSVSGPPYSRNAALGEGGSSVQRDEEPLSAPYPGEIPTTALGLVNMTDAAPGVPFNKRKRLSIEVPPCDAVEVSNSEVDIESHSTAKGFPGQKSAEDTYQVSLRFLDDLNSMTDDWTPEELENERRIVEFFLRPNPRPHRRYLCTHSRRKCSGYEEKLDTINLLERLAGTKFTIEEKNRIRRNLQGFKPATVSKNSPESEAFFRTLMEFPPPRPRNIEKDVKAFMWSKLPFMLEKVISKYWFVSSPSGSEVDESSPQIRVLREIEGASSESPSMSFNPLSASQTPTSVPSSQTEVGAMHTGIHDQSSYMSGPGPSPGENQRDKYHSGLPPQGRHLGYTQTSQSSTDSMYAHHETLMEMSETSMEELRSIPMADSQILSQYEDMETYLEGPEVQNPKGSYVHQGNVNEMADEEVHHIQYMTHTSYKYA
ncbi:hypothetical protein OPQ81_005701 [Rhizoctonia solani]|nr:hypothetical protein OPQ81_005701 [Rhizoctonia solani]